jgi:tetratricopeptide (TPR) repeat protein
MKTPGERTPRETADSGSTGITVPLPPGKRRAFFAATFALPFLVLLLAEITLRLLGYGPDLSLFITEQIRGTTYRVMNPALGARYFTGREFIPAPSTEYFLVPKPAGTYRIFCLGGSTVVGFPYWHNASFASFLRERLHRLFPDKQIEVINLGLTAVNSYTVLDIARELPGYGADLLIVYDGHNEFYGALGAASNDFLGSSRNLTFLYLRLVHSRLFLALRDGYVWVRSQFGSEPGTMERGPTLELLARGQYIPYGSRQYFKTQEIFLANLEDLRSLAHTYALPVILTTQVSNLRDLPPFRSSPTAGLSPEARRISEEHAAAGRAAGLAGRWEQAADAFRQAASIDTSNAITRFHLAQCLDSLGRRSEARWEYERARDFDLLRFRTSTDFNRIITGMDDGGLVSVADMEGCFAVNSPDSLIGRGLILDHLHPNSGGAFLMAREYARLLRQRGLLASPEEWLRCDTVSDASLWNDRPVSEFDERVAARRTELQMSEWPFPQNAALLPIDAGDTLGIYAQRVADGEWGWGDGHQAAIAFYRKKNDLPRLEREYRTMINLVPLETEPRAQLGRLALAEGHLDDAETWLKSALALEPGWDVYRPLGDIALKRNRANEAIMYYQKVLTFYQQSPEEADTRFALALACTKANLPAQAETQLRRILSLRPGDQRAATLLKTIEQMKIHP